MQTDITAKLKLENQKDILVINKPSDIKDFETLSYDDEEKKKKYNVIINFIFSVDEFIRELKNVINKDLLYPEGYLYFIYPKKGNRKYDKYIGRDDFFGPAGMNNNGYALNSKLKFNKMLAFDDNFTLIGLKSIEKEKKSTNTLSQRVNDYIDKIPDLKEYFAGNAELLNSFTHLTPGYQRSWARYIYSTKSEETINKRYRNMEKILKEGYKSIDLYRQAKNKE